MPSKFLRLVNNPFKYRAFLLKKLPAAFFSGVRVKYADESKAVITVPYKWFSTNPFRSTYFACLSMAAEMSTGLLALSHIYNQEPSVSMLIIKTEGVFYKKATGLTTFTCNDGDNLRQVISEARSSGKAVSFTCRSTGKNNDDEVVAEFTFTWSFKTRQSASPFSNTDPNV